MISYSKDEFSSIEEARKASTLMFEDAKTIIKDFEFLKNIKVKTFENKFTAIFGITKERFQKDEYLREFAS